MLMPADLSDCRLDSQDTYGMRVLSEPVQEDSIWMNGPPTWTYLQLALGTLPTEDAFEPFKREIALLPGSTMRVQSLFDI